MTALRGCDIILWEGNIPKIIDFSEPIRHAPAFGLSDIISQKDVQVQGLRTHTNLVSVAKISSRRWQH